MFDNKWIAPEVLQLDVSSTLAMSNLQDASGEAGGDGEEVPLAKLGFGRSPFPALPCLMERICANVSLKEYLPSAGLPLLRQLLATQYSARYGHRYDEGHVVVGPGSKELLYLVQRALEPSVRVCVVAPAWVSYAPQCKLTGHVLEVLPTTHQEGWCLTPETIRSCFGADAAVPRLLILNAPCNPTGAAYSREQVSALADSLRETNTIVVLDEIYADLHFGDAPFVSLAEYMPERCIISSGISKALGAGGYRLGYFIFPETLASLCRATVTLASETYSCAPSLVQHAYADVLRDHASDVQNYQARCRRILQAVCEHVAGRLRAFGIMCVTPQAAWYVLASFASYRVALHESNGIENGEQLSRALLQQARVTVLHDAAFRSSDDEGGGALAMRISLVDFDGERALKHLPPIDTALDHAWLVEYCPRVIAGIDRIGSFVAALTRAS